ncbi:hypothetical protein FRC01_012976 [Tulasnella sp. 417]|nr:hypothetical protein FRC01_012976 [Tulasnella sp. 417]
MPGRRSSKALKDFQTAESEDAPVTTSSATGIKALIGVFGDTNADLFISARALSIPELLSIVFSFSAEPELAISARVCKTWSDPALDELWVDLDTVFPLLELVLDLEPLRDEETDRAFLEEVSRALTGANWPRFHFYAQRVRSLRLGDLDYYYKDHAPLELRELIHLDIKLSQPSEARITEIFCALRNRTPKLKTFRLEIPYRNTFSEAALVSWLEKMETLEEIELPPYYLMPRILTVMKTFPRLRIIDQTPNPWYIPKDAGILEPLPENSFPSLVQLTLPATPAATQRFLFNSSTNFTSLTSLKLHTPDDIETNQLLSFTQQIASRGHSLTHQNIGKALSMQAPQ